MANNLNPKPTIIIHRSPSYPPLFHDRLSTIFSLLDPLLTSQSQSQSQSHNPSAILSFLRSYASDTRALLCVGLTPVEKDTLDCLPSLQLVALSCVGTNHVDLHECRRRGIQVTNIGDAFSDDVADFAVALLLDLFRMISGSDRFVRAGLWPQRGEYSLGSRLAGKRVGIVGLGSIGSRTAKRLSSFGCSIAYNSRQKKPSVSYPFYDKVYDLALDSDVLIICCSLTDRTRHMINKDILTALGRKGVIINVGRGALVDERVLVQYLVEGKIGGAGLDVFEDEPNVPKELFGLDNVVLSPHNAVLTPESFQASEDMVVANLEAFFSNKPLISPIRWE